MTRREDRTIHTNGVKLHVVQAGPESGPLVILLHGFPEHWRAWEQQIPALAEAGYRVWAPDQRGYNLSDKPRGVAAYRLDELVHDITGLIDAAGRETATVIGHDWGGAVAWRLATMYPSRLDGLVILNMAGLEVYRAYLRRSPSQLLKSWYVFFFQVPWLPEITARINGWQPLVQAMRRTALPGTFGEEKMAAYRQAWSHPGAYTAMLNWYRALLRHPPRLNPASRITVPTLMIWGAQEAFLEQATAQASIDRCENGQLVFVKHATHWVQHEAAGRVNELLRSFLKYEVDNRI